MVYKDGIKTHNAQLTTPYDTIRRRLCTVLLRNGNICNQLLLSFYCMIASKDLAILFWLKIYIYNFLMPSHINSLIINLYICTMTDALQQNKIICQRKCFNHQMLLILICVKRFGQEYKNHLFNKIFNSPKLLPIAVAIENP